MALLMHEEAYSVIRSVHFYLQSLQGNEWCQEAYVECGQPIVGNVPERQRKMQNIELHEFDTASYTSGH